MEVRSFHSVLVGGYGKYGIVLSEIFLHFYSSSFAAAWCLMDHVKVECRVHVLALDVSMLRGLVGFILFW